MFKKNMFPVVFLAVVLGIGLFLFFNRNGANVLDPNDAGKKVVDMINKKYLSGKAQASLEGVDDKNGVYDISIKSNDQIVHSYVTKNGAIFFPQGIEMSKLEKEIASKSVQELPKQDKPDVKLFVMSYCPYGLQSQKMFLPVYSLLKDKADMTVNFVDYAMHGKKELDENLRQYCIQKEQQDKYSDYLSCFVKDGKTDECLKSANVDTDAMQVCIQTTDKQYGVTEKYNNKSTWSNGQFPQFPVEKDLNDKYGISGSPTIVINDTVITSDRNNCPDNGAKCTVVPDLSRSPEKFKEVICNAFNTQPEECSTELEKSAFSPSFGYKKGSNSSSGSCN